MAATAEPRDDAFPPEGDWLQHEPPADLPVGDEFVGRTLAQLRHLGLIAPAEPGDGAPEVGDDEASVALPDELLATYRPPAASAGFVDRTLQAANRQRADQWRRLLLRYDAPEPTADFVARTLAALRPTTPAPARRGRLWFLGLAGVAAAVLLFVLRPTPAAPVLRSLLAAAPATSALSQSPAVLSHLLAAVDDHELPVTAPAGSWLWLAAAEDR